MEGSVSLFVGGGQEFHGPTAARDANITIAVAKMLAFDAINVITGGTPGVPDLFASNFNTSRVLDVVSEEHEAAYVARNTGREYFVAGKTQEERRLAVTHMPGIKCALFIQGGQFTTHEILLIQEQNIPIVCLEGGGGAAGGKIAYKDVAYKPRYFPSDPCASTDPDADVQVIARALVEKIKVNF